MSFGFFARKSSAAVRLLPIPETAKCGSERLGIRWGFCGIFRRRGNRNWGRKLPWTRDSEGNVSKSPHFPFRQFVGQLGLGDEGLKNKNKNKIKVRLISRFNF